jgi:hypothetical protein
MDFNNLFEYRDGELFWLVRAGRYPIGHKAGTLRKDGYVGVYYKGKYYFAHRIIWEMLRQDIPGDLVIDHIDGDRSNNRIENLRLCTFRENHYNRKIPSHNKSGFKGVSWHKQKQKWVAQIKIEGRNKFLGFFDDPLEAYGAYCEKAIEYYGEYARLD